MKTFAANLDRLTFTSEECMLAFLIKVAEQKVIDEHRRSHAQKRDVDRKCSIDTARDDGSSYDLPDRGPTGSQWVLADEMQERLFARRSETEREIIQMRKEGHSNFSIAEATGWNIRKVQRFLKDLEESFVKIGV
jgi:DNA-directed RNA polymerase specialized sigma24 family protein